MYRGRPPISGTGTGTSVTFSDIPDDLDDNELNFFLMDKLGATTIRPVINTEAKEFALYGLDRGQRNI